MKRLGLFVVVGVTLAVFLLSSVSGDSKRGPGVSGSVGKRRALRSVATPKNTIAMEDLSSLAHSATILGDGCIGDKPCYDSETYKGLPVEERWVVQAIALSHCKKSTQASCDSLINASSDVPGRVKAMAKEAKEAALPEGGHISSQEYNLKSSRPPRSLPKLAALLQTCDSAIETCMESASSDLVLPERLLLEAVVLLRCKKADNPLQQLAMCDYLLSHQRELLSLEIYEAAMSYKKALVNELGQKCKANDYDINGLYEHPCVLFLHADGQGRFKKPALKILTQRCINETTYDTDVTIRACELLAQRAPKKSRGQKIATAKLMDFCVNENNPLDPCVLLYNVSKPGSVAQVAAKKIFNNEEHREIVKH